MSETPDDRAVSLLLTLAAGIALDEPVGDWEDEYRELCADGVDASWDFDQLDAWLVDASIAEDTASRIRSLIDKLR